MDQTEIRTGFNQMIAAAAQANNAEAVARLEIAREYFANPEFKSAVQDIVWAINTKRA